MNKKLKIGTLVLIKQLFFKHKFANIANRYAYVVDYWKPPVREFGYKVDEQHYFLKIQNQLVNAEYANCHWSDHDFEHVFEL